MIEQALQIDILVLMVCVYLLLRHGKLTYSHPAVTYLLFHLFIVTWRLFSIMQGSPTLYGSPDWPISYDEVTFDEIVRAAGMADLALGAMTLGCLIALRDDRNRQKKHPDNKSAQVRTLSRRNIMMIGIPAFVIGLVGLYVSGVWLPIERETVNLGIWSTSSWIGITPFWPVLVLLALIYWDGLRLKWVVLFTPLFALIALQGGKRFRAIATIIALTQIYLDRRNLKWPPVWLALLLLCGSIAFFPLKSIGRLVQEGAPLEQIIEVATTKVEDVTSGDGDGQLLDEFAAVVTAVDRRGQFYYGSVYLALFTLPIPRQLWPDKPGSVDYMWELTSPTRPFGTLGMTPLSWGEYYANFGYPGLVAMTLLLAYGLSRFYFYAFHQSYYSVARFAYLIFVANFLQIYRDGLLSLVLFVLMNMMPLTLIVILHYFRPSDEVLAHRLALGRQIPIIRDRQRWLTIQKLAQIEHKNQ